MLSRLEATVERWCDGLGVESTDRPDLSHLATSYPSREEFCRPGVGRAEILGWERRHGFTLPEGLKAWLELSDGLFLDGPMIHPLSAIGPMVPFARVPGLLVQPESWFELGNPNVETVCIELGYRWPRGGQPIFTSGDDRSGTLPLLIASSFESWFLAMLNRGGREYWFDPGFQNLGDPWKAHRAHVPVPALMERLSRIAPKVVPMVRAGVDDRAIATRLGLSPFDVEAIIRHLQHRPFALADRAE